jgi:hypothetical protein
MLTHLWTLMARIRAAATRRDLDRDFDSEMDSHLAMLAEEKVRRGMSPDQALRAARVELGGRTQLREAHREARGLPRLDALLGDVRYALRTLGNNAGVTGIAVLTLATGIGVNTAVFTAYNAIALRPIQAPEPHRAAQITRSNGDDFYSYPDYVYYRDHGKTMSLVAMSFGHTVSMSGAGATPVARRATLANAAGFKLPNALAGSPERAMSVGVSGNYFGVLGIHAVLGRRFLPEDDSSSAQPVALVSQNFWERRFGKDPGILGRTLTLNGEAVTIIGITPAISAALFPSFPTSGCL